MPIPLHGEARERIFQKLSALLEGGCRRWQSKRDGWSQSEIKSGGRRLKLRTFWAEEFDDAPRKFLKACEQGVRSPEHMWIQTPLRFEQLMIKLRRVGQPARERWFDEGDLADFEEEWLRYWAIEKDWLRPHVSKAELMRLFKQYHCDDIASALKTGPVSRRTLDDVAAWCHTHIDTQYFNNNYQAAIDAGNAFLSFAFDEAAKDPKEPLNSMTDEPGH